MDKKIKIAMVTNHFGITGISTVILNYCKELDYHKYDLTVIAGRPIAEENRKECAENGIHLIVTVASSGVRKTLYRTVESTQGKPLRHCSCAWQQFYDGN